MAGVTLGYLRYVLGFDTLSFRKGATEAEVRMQKMERTFKRSFGAINAGFAGFAAAFSVGLLTAGITKALEYAGSLAEVAQQLGVTAKDLQLFRYAAGQVGVSQEELEVGLNKLTITLGKVAVGAKEPAKALAAIGISADQLKGKDAGQAFRIIADGLQKVTDRSQRAAVEVALFGKTGSKLDNLLAGGSGAINELAAAADKLGIVLSDEQIQKADETADKLRALKTVLAANIAGVVADNANSIVSLATSLSQLTSEIAKFLNSNPQLALAIIGGLVGGRVGGLPGAGVGVVAGVAAGAQMARNRDDANMDPEFRRQQAIAARRELDARRSSSSSTIFRVRKGSAGSGSTVDSAEAEYKRQIQLLVAARRAAARPKTGATGTSTDIQPFLASSGGEKKGKDLAAEAERKRREQMRDAYQFAQDERRGQLDILRAQQDLTVNTEDRARLALEMLDVGHKAALAEIQYQVDSGNIDGAQAKILIAQEDKLAALQRDAIAADNLAQKSEDEDRMAETRFGIRRAELQAMLNLAQTSDERRRLSLELLDLEYQEKRQALERVVANKQLTDAVRARAQAELDALPQQQALDTKGVMQSTQGPWESWLQNARDTTDAMQQLKVQGVEGLIDSLSALSQGWKSMGQVARQVLMDIVQQMLRIQLTKMFANLLGSAAGGIGGGGAGAGAGGFSLGGGGLPGPMTFGGGFSLTGRARGGPVKAGQTYLIGERGPELFTADRAGRIIPNHKMRGGWSGGAGGVTQYFDIRTPDPDSFRRSLRQIQRDARRNLAIGR